nr:hypothetical protein [uncultured Campylobacter sp.]
MKFLFLLYACAEKFRAAKIGAINVPLSPEASMAEFHAAKREDAMKFLEFFCKRAERGLEILKFLGARYFGSHKQAAEFLNFTPAPSRNGFRILNFTPKLRNGLEILKFMRASAPFADTAQNFISQRGLRILKLICEPLRIPSRVLPSADVAEAGRAVRFTSQHTHDATEKRSAVKINQYLNYAQRRIARLCSAAARHGYEAGRAEKFSKFDFANVLLNFISLPPRKFKLVLLKFSPEPPRNGFRILKFTPELSNRFEILKFTLAPHKFKPASNPFLNFISNFNPPARAAKFENGVKFKGTAKFKKGAR